MTVPRCERGHAILGANRLWLGRHMVCRKCSTSLVKLPGDGTDAWQRPDFYDDAACSGLTRLFFSMEAMDQITACHVCQSCPVREQCLDYVRSLPTLEREGTWGGQVFNPHTRRKGGSSLDPTRRNHWFNYYFRLDPDEWLRLARFREERLKLCGPDAEGRRQHDQRLPDWLGVKLRRALRPESAAGGEEEQRALRSGRSESGQADQGGTGRDGDETGDGTERSA